MVLHRIHTAYKANQHGGLRYAPRMPHPLAARWIEAKVGRINAILDHPHSFRYPTHWHVRNYGLMTANPFGYSAYTNGLKDGSHVLQNGDTLPFRYRVALHRGSCEQATINEHYLNFAAPPRVTITT